MRVKTISPKTGPNKLRRYATAIFAAVALLVIFVGPWPIASTPYQRSDYAAATFDRINALATDLQSGPLYGGVASVDMTPPLGVPLAGYSARNPKANTGARERVFAKALTLDNGHQDVTILTGDYLLPMPTLVDEVLRRTGLAREHIYFASTHTHSGPGGYQRGLIAESALGDFDPAQLERMATAMAKAVLDSRAALQPVSLDADRFQLSPNLAYTMVSDQFTKGPGHASIDVLQMTRKGGAGPAATLVTFSAHPTFLGRVNKEISGDYPAVLQRVLQQRLGGEVLFAAGAVGGMEPMAADVSGDTDLEIQLRQVQDLGSRLGETIADALAEKDSGESAPVRLADHWHADAAPIAEVAIDVDLPSPSYHLFEQGRMSPLLVDWLFHDGDTTVSALRIGKLVFLGFPADFSGELARGMEAWSRQHGQMAWITSFSGDYVGYIMPHTRYATPHYTTRTANIYGPWAGEYFVDISQRLMEKLAPGAAATQHP